jgi:hypothetical protein
MVRALVAVMIAGVVVVTASNCGSDCSKDADCEEVVCADGSKHRTCEEGVCMTFSDCTTKATGW